LKQALQPSPPLELAHIGSGIMQSRMSHRRRNKRRLLHPTLSCRATGVALAGRVRRARREQHRNGQREKAEAGRLFA
jgi:hypothetical protein